jgi:hypothetical protein
MSTLLALHLLLFAIPIGVSVERLRRRIVRRTADRRHEWLMSFLRFLKRHPPIAAALLMVAQFMMSGMLIVSWRECHYLIIGISGVCAVGYTGAFAGCIFKVYDGTWEEFCDKAIVDFERLYACEKHLENRSGDSEAADGLFPETVAEVCVPEDAPAALDDFSTDVPGQGPARR